MAFSHITVENFTVFEKLDLRLSPGINVLIGENGMGKTHIMKLLYSAGKAVRRDISFSHKVLSVFLPDDSGISRLVSRRKGIDNASVTVYTDTCSLSMRFNKKTAKWNAEVLGEPNWEEQLAGQNFVFIPAKEILSNGWHFEAAVRMGNVEFDDTYVDVVSAAKIDLGGDDKSQKKYLDILQKATSGKVELEKDRFYLKKGPSRLEFSLVAEGIRKLALLWQLIKNGALECGDVLFWDEPEANLNPKYIPVVAEILLELQRDGIQVFVSTHDYFLSKYFEIRRQKDDAILYHSLYSAGDTVLCESQARLDQLEHNVIQDIFIQMYREEIEKAMG